MPKTDEVSVSESVSPEGDSHRGTPSVSTSTLETVPPRARRQFSPADKLRLVKAADAALASGERGALQSMLRAEGLYSTQLAEWRQQLGATGIRGLASRKPGRMPKLDAKDREVLAARKEVETLERRLRVANAVIDLQKKAHELLGLALPEGGS
jgi:transposase-like protein